MTDLRQAAQQALDAWDDPAGMKDLCVAMDALRTALAMHQVSEFAQAQEQAEPVAMRMPKVGDRVICLEDESLGEVVSLTAGGSPDIVFDDGSRGTYLLREFAELFSYVAPPQQQAEPVARENFEKWAKFAAPYMDISRFEAGYSDCNTDYAWAGWQAALAQPQQQAEPVAWMDREGDLYKMPEIKNWAPPHTMLYTTSPQIQWAGLTDEDVNRESAPIAQQMKLAFHAGMYVAQKILKERNHD